MKLPDHFSFNQQNLQDYLDCPRRFYLRHILRQDWPAIESEPVKEQEALILLGEQFHRMVQQLFAGIPQEIIESSTTDPDLLNWWRQFIHLDIQSRPGSKFSEILLSIPFEGTRLIAKYDLIVYQEIQQAVIYDWKTSRHLPKEKWLALRMQTRIYPFLLATLSAQPGTAFHLSLEQIQMVYWYPAFPDKPFAFPYSQSQFSEDERFLSSTIHEIVRIDESGFTKTDNEKLCKYCRYRSLCDRGISAGERPEAEALENDTDSAFDIDFDQISAAE
jgi:CRISPR/Cas system-associated exonuclease Cas4 (RecB family)